MTDTSEWGDLKNVVLDELKSFFVFFFHVQKTLDAIYWTATRCRCFYLVDFLELGLTKVPFPELDFRAVSF